MRLGLNTPESPLLNLLAPITEGDVITIRLSRSSSSGLDVMTVQRWFSQVPAIIRAVIFNIFMVAKTVPLFCRDSRTVLVPKVGDRMFPAHYRPISVTSVILRHFHKNLAKHMLKYCKINSRQRAFISADGCAENVSILSALQYEAIAE